MEGDEELVRRIRKGDLDAFDLLYKRYERRLFGYIRRMVKDHHLAEDLFQDVILTVLEDRRFELREGRFAGFLFTVARNRCLRHKRDATRRKEKGREMDPDEHVEQTAASDPELDLELKQEGGRLKEALFLLPETHQDTFMLKQVGRLTYKEIAEIQDIPVGTVKSRIHLVIQALKEHMERWAEKEGAS